MNVNFISWHDRDMRELAAEFIDRTWCAMRVWSPEEKRYYQQVADYFVKAFGQ